MEIQCPKIRIGNDDSWDDIRLAFQGSAECRMGQAWLPAPDPRFRSGVVRSGWRAGEWLVYAELEDDEAFNPISDFNGLLFMHGDVLELFLRPVDQAAYCELHIAPNNQKFQLRIPSGEVFRRPRAEPGVPKEWLVRDPVIFSRVRVEAAQRRWLVFAAIPFGMVSECGTAGPGTRWKFSFSRYDYTRGESEPVHSSTSPHKRLNFHIQEDWGILVFT